MPTAGGQHRKGGLPAVSDMEGFAGNRSGNKTEERTGNEQIFIKDTPVS